MKENIFHLMDEGDFDMAFKVSMDEYGYAVWKLPTELWKKLKNAINGELPKENELEPIFTRRKNSKMMSKKLKESWIPVQDQQLFFGILELQNPGTSLWVKRRLGNGELDKQLQPGGEVFLGRGSLIHGGGTMPGVRLHFLYLGDKEREKYHNYTQ